jgi:HlyD family secretion protein
MDRRLRNRVLLFLVLAGLVAFGLVRLSERKPVASVRVVEPRRETLISSISSNGKVEPVAPYAIRAQLDTFLERVFAVEGQQVTKGQLLMRLDVKDARAQLARARAALVEAQDDLRIARAGGRPDEAAQLNESLAHAGAELGRLQKEHEALKKLVAVQAATRDELARNELELAQARDDVKRLEAAKQEFDGRVKLTTESAALRVEQALSQVAAFEEQVSEGEIHTPAGGTLYSLPVKTRDFVKVGDLLAELADLHQVRVRAFIDEPELGGLEPNQPVIITWDGLPGRSWEGKTEVIPKQVVTRGTRSVGELLCSVKNDKLELLPNLNVNVRVNERTRQDALAVPRGAVETESGRRYVFVVKDDSFLGGRNTLEKRQIQVGLASPTSFEVISGLSEGETIALPGDVDLRNGMRVQVVKTE